MQKNTNKFFFNYKNIIKLKKKFMINKKKIYFIKKLIINNTINYYYKTNEKNYQNKIIFKKFY